MNRVRLAVVILVSLVWGLGALAQNPTGTLSGTVTDGNGPLPGVTVSVTSPSLQGQRVTVTTVNGDYIFAFLPAGEYTIRFELQGFQSLETTRKISAAQTAKVDAVMPQSKVSEQITVTGTYETISKATSAATTYEHSLIEKLPMQRNLYNAVSLAPGVHTTGPSNNITISGAQSYESLFLINGAVVNENVRGQATELYIEDAVQETTTMTSGISAEYGRFSGGVVNMLTKSGGNEFHASFRTNFTNDQWTERTPLTTSRTNKTNETYEATLGGFIVKDKLWFFGAGRDLKLDQSDQTYGTLVSFPTSQTEKRYEGKLTFAPVTNHRLIGSYISRDRSWVNYYFPSRPPVDMTQMYDRSIPESFLSGNYTGIFSDSFFAELQYSQRKLTFQRSGGRFTDLIQGTPLIDRATGAEGNAPVFCGVCKDETRDNKDYLAKASYFLSSERLGSHDIIGGLDRFSDMIDSDNHQSGSDWDVRVPKFIYSGQTWYPQVPGGPKGTSVQIVWWPIPQSSRGTDFRTDSAFVNDRWRFNSHLTFSLGVRYDKNDGKNALGQVVSKDSRFSPRLGVAFDPKGDGDWIVNASYGHYVSSLAGTGNVANASPAGNPSTLIWYYRGPDINTGAGPYVNPADVVKQIFNWFNTQNCDSAGNCGTTNLTSLVAATFRGFNRVIQGSLRSPYAEEIAVGAVKRLGNHGLVRLDYTHRNFKDLYETRLDLGTGQVEVVTLGQNWGKQDLGLIQNSSFLTRKYDGVDLQAQYRVGSWDFGGNYTWSHSYGNNNGETSGSGPVTNTSVPGFYPQYQNASWSNPTGDLAIDQRHKARVWVVWTPISSRHHSLSVSLLEGYASGTPYGAVGAVRSYLYVQNPGYRTPPTTVSYYYTSRNAFHTDNVSSTDIAFNYAFKFPTFGSGVEFFVQPRVQNVFNEKAVVNPDATVYDRASGVVAYKDFNPFTDKPVEGVNWAKGPNFGKATSPLSYQTPRTFRFSVGVRF